MKVVIKPSSIEESIYYCDFSGKSFGEFLPDVSISIDCNYNSEFDGENFKLHLSDLEFKNLLNFIKINFSSYSKDLLKKNPNLICQYLTND